MMLPQSQQGDDEPMRLQRTVSVVDDGSPEADAAIKRLRASGAHVTVWPAETGKERN